MVLACQDVSPPAPFRSHNAYRRANMTFIPTPGVLRVRTKIVWNNINIGNRFFVQYGSGGGGATAGDISAFAAAFESAYHTRFLPYLPTSVSLQEVIVEDQTSDTGASASWSGTVAGTGGSAQTIDSAVCGVVSWGIARRYRGGKPRTYIGPLSSEMIDQNTLASGKAAALATSALAFQSDIGSMSQPSIGSPVLGTVSYYLNKVKRTNGYFEQFTNVRVNQRLGTQRRRLGKLQAYAV